MTHDDLLLVFSAGNTRKHSETPRYFWVLPGFFAIFCLLAAEQQ